MNDISGFGLKVQIVASVTFPAGITITQFADDSDPFDVPAQDIADKAMGLNGDLITWSKANPIMATLNVIPESEDDINLSILAEANRAAKGKNSARDVITMTVMFPNGKVWTASPGAVMNFSPGDSVASASRLKSKPYAFAFENKVEVFA